MCGICGFIDPEMSRERALDVLRSMAGTLRHRGPDDHGQWHDGRNGVGLSHRRLSIIDLSPEGHQPMQSASGRYVIVYNGEIYNHADLKAELDSLPMPPSWRGHSDTEVMLAAFERWGLEEAVKRFAGMFAFAVWDRDEETLHLVRDRLGEKPLYYGRSGRTLFFASELKALRAHPSWRGNIDRNALCLYLRYSYVPAPYSIYGDVRKLPPGTILSLKPTSAALQVPNPSPYWTIRAVAEKGMSTPYPGDDRQAEQELDERLRHVIRQQMVSDVPLGAFLSGGVDSSTVVAIMQAVSGCPVKTFTIGFREHAYDEAVHARRVARHLGTEHTELYVTPDEALEVIPQIPSLYDEPFADSSQIPTCLVSELARRHVTVSLSGDGGDEAFGGYVRYFWVMRLWDRVRAIPTGLRALLGEILTAVPPRHWDRVLGALRPILPGSFEQTTPGDKLHKLARVLAARDPGEMYVGLVSNWKRPADVVLGAAEPTTPATDRSQWADLPGFIDQMMYLDALTYLPDDILVKVDRAAMGRSLETRVPFLDHRLVEFAWRLPPAMKIRNGEGKWLLRQVLARYVPRELIERPKSGFAVPIDAWLRGPLREWADALLDTRRIREDSFFDSGRIRACWAEHLDGSRNRQHSLWAILMFQAWLDAQRN
jgi:asparagine synthase (glutamine-hydrolysing)